MKKIAVVLGAAAIATLTGCRDQDYDARRGKRIQDEPKSIETVPAKPAEVTPVAVKPQEIKVEEKHCTCAPGAKHTEPCKCGASDCTCVVEKPLPPPAPAPEFTTYVVQSGDYLAKISKKFNVTISSLKRVNNLKSDTIRVGQKLKIPGKVDVGVQAAPVTAAAKSAAKPTVKKGYAPYTGATKEYVVKNGDTLGSVAYGNGLNIRQLKELNKLTGDSLKVGQKLKIPAEKVVTAKKVEVATKAVETKKAEVEVKKAEVEVKKAEAEAKAAQVEVKEAEAEVKKAEAAVIKETEVVPPTPAAPATSTDYVVQEGEDLTRLSIDFGVSTSVIRELNNLGENDQVKPGQVLKIPAESQQ